MAQPLLPFRTCRIQSSPPFLLSASLLAVGVFLDKDVVRVDEGNVCLSGVGTAQVIPSRQASPMSVTASCETSCNTDVSARCSATVDGSVVTIDSLIAYNYDGDACSLECHPISATCSLPALSSGTYTVVHGGSSTKLTVGEPAPACF